MLIIRTFKYLSNRLYSWHSLKITHPKNSKSDFKKLKIFQSNFNTIPFQQYSEFCFNKYFYSDYT